MRLLATLVVALVLAGCTEEPRFARVQVADMATAHGIDVRVEVSSRGQELVIDVHAVNERGSTWRIPGSCVGTQEATEPWSVAARTQRGREQVVPIFPEEGCGSVTTREFPRGAETSARFTWDGSYVFDDGHARAIPGMYDLEVAFELYEDDDEAEDDPIVVVLPIEVLR